MREAIGGTWLFQIVIFFIIFFTGFMCLTINRSKAFNVKNQIVQTIQAYNGIDLTKTSNNDAMEEIVSYMKEHAYRTTGVWPDTKILGGEFSEYYCYDRNGRALSRGSKNAIFCLAKIPVKNSLSSVNEFNELRTLAYYRVVVFYQLDVPIFHDLFNFQMVGDTKTIYEPARNDSNSVRWDDVR